jgi:hypothetical protein
MVNMVTITCVPCASPSALSRWFCQVSKERAPDRESDRGKPAAARAVNAAAAEGSASRTPSDQRQRAPSGSTRASVAGVTHARPGLLRG